jgi:hypothetical protein
MPVVELYLPGFVAVGGPPLQAANAQAPTTAKRRYLEKFMIELKLPVRKGFR